MHTCLYQSVPIAPPCERIFYVRRTVNGFENWLLKVRGFGAADGLCVLWSRNISTYLLKHRKCWYSVPRVLYSAKKTKNSVLAPISAEFLYLLSSCIFLTSKKFVIFVSQQPVCASMFQIIFWTKGGREGTKLCVIHVYSDDVLMFSATVSYWECRYNLFYFSDNKLRKVSNAEEAILSMKHLTYEY
jgi:hypothetical protein